MAILTGIKNGIGVKITGKLGQSGSPDPKNVKGIYRVRHRWGKVIQEKMPFYVPTNPQTQPQQANRQKFADGITAWHALTSEQKAAYNEIAKYENYYGISVFMSEYLLSH